MINYEAIPPFIIGSIILLSILSLVEIIILIRWLYVKLNYTKKISAKVIGKYGDDGSSYSHRDYNSSHPSPSKGESTYFELAYTIDGVDYKAMLQGLSIYTKKGDMVDVKYHKKDHNKIVDTKFNWGAFIYIGLFMIPWIIILIVLLNIK